MTCLSCDGLIARSKDSPGLGKLQQKPPGYPLEEERIGDIGNDEEAPLYGNRNRKFPKKTESR